MSKEGTWYPSSVFSDTRLPSPPLALSWWVGSKDWLLSGILGWLVCMTIAWSPDPVFFIVFKFRSSCYFTFPFEMRKNLVFVFHCMYCRELILYRMSTLCPRSFSKWCILSISSLLPSISPQSFSLSRLNKYRNK